jgi:large conductance mechanosensitive channel
MSKGIFQEFKNFAIKGNLIDMAVAFIMGGAFGKVVTSFIDGLIMPIVGLLTAGADFKSLRYIILSPKKDEAGNIIHEEIAIHYGAFITAMIDFLLIAFFMFLMVKAMNKAREKLELEKIQDKMTREEELLTEIRDLLKTPNSTQD